MNHDDVAKFASLFQGRTDAYGMEEGGCDRNAGERVLERHLNGERAIGVYPLTYQLWVDDDDRVIEEGWYVRWGCVDFDVKSDSHPSYDFETEDDAHAAAVDLKALLGVAGIHAWIERTRSCGRHVWVFADTYVPAALMRRALIVACEAVDVPTREVNPKQEALEPEQLGNYVRLPYPGCLALNASVATERVMLWDGPGDWRAYQTYPLTMFVDVAYQNRCTKTDLQQLAHHYVVPDAPKVQRAEIQPYRGELRELSRRLEGNTYAVFENGPTTGDRSGALVYVAHGCARVGLTYDEAYALVENLDERLGKYVGRADRQRQLSRIVGRAY